MRRLADFLLRLDRGFPDGLESLVWNAHLRLTDRYLGYQSFAATNNDLNAVKRALTELLVSPPDIDLDFLASLLEWAERQRPSVNVAAEWTAALLLRSLQEADREELTGELIDIYWGDIRLFRLGHATDWLAKYLAHVDGYDDHRGVRRSFVYNALDFAPHVELLCAPVAPSSDLEQQALERVAGVLDECPTLRGGLALDSGESSAQLVARAVELFRTHEEARRLRRSPRE